MAKRRKSTDDGKHVYDHPLVARNASREMAALFSPQHKFSMWRRLWVALAEAEHELGLKVSARQIAAMRRVVDDIDYVAAAHAPPCSGRASRTHRRYRPSSGKRISGVESRALGCYRSASCTNAAQNSVPQFAWRNSSRCLLFYEFLMK